MLLYTHVITPRLRFISEFIGNELTGKPIRLTSDKDIFRLEHGPKINYSSNRVAENEYWVEPHSLLFETGLNNREINCTEWEGMKIFFRTGGDLPFDMFAATFYLMSRYEEYLPHKKDLYGRYACENSLAFRQGFLSLPLVNIWIMHFRESLCSRYPDHSFLTPSFKIIPTYDIDEAWSFKFKSSGRNLGATLKNFLKGDWHTLAARRKVQTGLATDPFDAYDWMDALHLQYHLEPIYFFLVAEKTGRYDRNILPTEKALQQLIREHGGKYKIGVHPSWQSGEDNGSIRKEVAILETITGKPITSSRQHFLRFTLPVTYRQLLSAGLREDFSMGYGTHNGFRASVSSPFYWYDLEKEEKTDLMLYPFCFMDANAFFEQKVSPAAALDEMLRFYQEVKAVNGTFITAWHNTFLGTGKLFKGWRDAYAAFFKQITSV